MKKVTLVLGGARSGKSRHAEALGSSYAGRRIYIATAENTDAEMADRIARHRAGRGEGWDTVEAPLDLASAIASAKAPFVLVDCITVWLGNLMHHNRDLAAELDVLCQMLAAVQTRVVIVSNEVGLSVVPENRMARAFRDAQGIANQRIAELADEVVFVAAGLPLLLKKATTRRRAPTTG
ncbi:bifunctional adenosylcobinamide kinase/adenosylcobinamide-phosphate guanylyltransferase [Aestuariivirga sp.]|uniref:bifunctional adenosylcobinamide kinase/adenosylcobinamide-phosphate guanylyltransferase n=1 Tax=Aestuariivirga sp. TaxID=2650926 RepID=UPI0039E4F3A7